jgi:hypothetical protein
MKRDKGSHNTINSSWVWNAGFGGEVRWDPEDIHIA